MTPTPDSAALRSALEPILAAIAKSGKVEEMDWHHIAALAQPAENAKGGEVVADDYIRIENAECEGMDKGADFCIKTLAKALGVDDWEQADGSETWHGDVAGTIYNVLKAGRVYDEEDGRVARFEDAHPPAAYREQRDLLSAKEWAAVEHLGKEQELSISAVLRQAVRQYQSDHERRKAGETVKWSGDEQRAIDFAGPLYAHPPADAPPVKQSLTSEAAVRDALLSELGDAYDCGRVWEAWSVGTMGEDDFSPISDRVDDIVGTVMAALQSASAAEPVGLRELRERTAKVADGQVMSGNDQWSAGHDAAARKIAHAIRSLPLS